MTSVILRHILRALSGELIMEIAINRCYGGFSLSQAALERLIELGIPRRRYITEKIDPKTNLFLEEPQNEGEVIFDDKLIPEKEKDEFNAARFKLRGSLWETWVKDSRTHPLVIKVIKELGEKANSSCARIKIVDVPDGVNYFISDYDGMKTINEEHRSWS